MSALALKAPDSERVAAQLFKAPIRLNLGAGNVRQKYGFVTLDANQAMQPDIVATVPPIPLPDGCCAEIYASHFLEHLDNDEASALLAEVWRVLEPNGLARFVAPYALSDDFVQDPTHKSAWCATKFLYYTPHFRYLGYGFEDRFQVLRWQQSERLVAVDLVKTGGGEVCRCPICKQGATHAQGDRDQHHASSVSGDDLQDLPPGGVREGRGPERNLRVVRAAGEPGTGEPGASGRDGDTGSEVVPRRILFVWPAADISTVDVASGYRRALARQGHDIRDYRLSQRLGYHLKAMGKRLAREHPWEHCRQASDNLLPEAMRHRADVVFVVNGHALHPNSVALARQAGFRIACLFTESPYEDADQAEFAELCDVVFCNERTSARRLGWRYLAHAFEPGVHRPVAADQAFASDVLMVASGWPERQALLEAIDWTGIDFKLRGMFADLTAVSPLAPFYVKQLVNNEHMPAAYAATKIALNHHRTGLGAESLGPRAYEIAACGVFQICDDRPEAREVFGDSVPVYHDAAECERLIRYYLARPRERAELAAEAQRRVQGHTFDNRARELTRVINQAIPI